MSSKKPEGMGNKKTIRIHSLQVSREKKEREVGAGEEVAS